MHVRIEVTYKTVKGLKTVLNTEEMSAKKAIVIADDLVNTGRTTSLIFIDRYESRWGLKDLKKYMQELQTEPHDVTVYFDGGFDRKSQKAGLGCAIYYEQNERKLRLRRNALIEGIRTNNEAEYAALSFSIKELDDLGVHHLPVLFIGDSMVAINQLNEEWPCYEEELSNWIDRIERQIDQLNITPDYKIVPRKENKEADQLASQALDEIEITSTKKVT